MIAKVLSVVCVLALCSSCETKQINELSYAELKSLSLELHKRCWAEGVKSNSPEMNMCLQQEFNRESAMRRRNFESSQAFGDSMIAGGQSYSNALQRPAYRASSCTSTPSSTWVGGPVSQVRTTCY